MSKDTVLDDEVTDLIRAAHRAGEETVEIDGKLFKLKLVSREVNFTTGGETHRRLEEWLVATPADGRAFVPVYSVERVPLPLRSAHSLWPR